MRGQGYNAAGEVYSAAYVAHDPVDLAFDEPSQTRQEFKDECDVNVLMARYEKTGVMPMSNGMEPAYLDIVDTPPLMEALQIMHDAQEAFMRLPAATRREFDNDPVEFVKFAQNADNLDKMREWGLAEPLPVEPAPTKVEIIGQPFGEPVVPDPVRAPVNYPKK